MLKLNASIQLRFSDTLHRLTGAEYKCVEFENVLWYSRRLSLRLPITLAWSAPVE